MAINNDLIEIKKSLKTIIKDFSSITNEMSPWKKLLTKAQQHLKQIEYYEGIIIKDEKFNIILEQDSKQSKNYQSIERKVKELEHIELLKKSIIKGYAFIQEFSNFMRQEKLQYLLLFNDSAEQKIGVYSLEDLLPSLNITYNSQQGFNIQINELSALQELKNKETNVIQNFTQKAIKMFNFLLQRKKSLVSYQRQRKLTRRQRREREEQNRKMYGGRRGLEGIVFEQAVNRLARAIVTGERMDIEVENFKADNSAFYLRGDIEQKEFIETIVSEAQNLALELKVVRSRTISGYSQGARLTGSSTVKTTLITIIDILKKDNNKEIFNQLNKFFEAKASSLAELIESYADNFAKEISEANISRIK